MYRKYKSTASEQIHFAQFLCIGIELPRCSKFSNFRIDVEVIITHNTVAERTDCVTGPIRSELLVRKMQFSSSPYMYNQLISINLSLDCIKPRDFDEAPLFYMKSCVMHLAYTHTH